MKVYLLSQKGINKDASEDRVLVGNEVFSDQEAVRILSHGHVLLADGVGGNNAGAVAALQVCKKMSDIAELTPESFSAINEHLISMSAANENYRNMATTATGVHFSSTSSAQSYHVGNTRLYAIQAGEYLKQLTTDDTVVEYLIRTGKLTEEEAVNYPARNEITACFGGGKSSLLRIKTDYIDLVQYRQFLLTCDGIHDYLSTDEMEDILGSCDGDWAKALRELASRAKENSSPDDCSAVIIDCDNIESEATRAGNEDQTCSNVQPDALAPVEEKEHHELSEDAFEPKGVSKSRLMSFFKKKNEDKG